MVRIFFILLITGLACTYPTQGQQYPMHNYSMQDGLPNSLVYRIYQDRKGFIWFCTDNGLSLFNGKTFHNYFVADGLGDDCIMSLSEDTAGNKLISTFGGGISIMSGNSIKQLPLQTNYATKKIICTSTQNGITWFIGNSGGQSLFRIKDSRIKEFDVKDSAGGKVYFNKMIPYSGKILFATSDGIYETNGDSILSILHNIIHEQVIDVRLNSSGGYWIALNNRVVRVAGNKIAETHFVGNKQHISNILVDRHDNVWAALAGHGIFIVKDGCMTDITSALRMQRTIINDIFEDNEGDIWIATYNEGVDRINSLNIINYFAEGSKTSIYTKSIAAIDSNTILIGSIGKVNVWKNGIIEPLDLKLLKADEYVYTVYFSENKAYVGTPVGLYVKNLRYPSSERLLIAPTGSGILSFYKDSKNRIWAGGYGSIFHLDNNELILDSAANKILNGKRCKAIFEDHKGDIWFGTDSGLIIFNGKDYARLSLPDKPGIAVINTIFEDSHKRMWLGTKSGLLCRENNQFRIFTTANGLAHNKCNDIIEDKSNRLWVGTLSGLSYIDLSTLDIKEYRIGIYPSEILSLYCKDSNNIFVGTSDGLSLINTNHISVADAAPPLYITSVKTARYHIYMPGAVSLPYNENRLAIDFIGLNYRNPDMVEYRYKIINLDNNWHVTRNTSIELPALPSGEYTFILNARQNKGRWSNDVVLPIVVSTPFWKNWWFIVAIFIIASSAIFFVTRWQIMKSENKKRQQLTFYNKIIYLKQQALSALINPHFIFNCLNSIQHYVNNHDNDKANIYLADFASLIRMTMDNAQEAFINLSKEIERIKLYLSLEQLRFGEDLQYEIIIDNSLPVSATLIPNMILQPYVENAILHGIVPKDEPGNILIKILPESRNTIKITIEDDGVGVGNNERKKFPHEHVPLGMKLTAERLNLLQKLLGHYYSITVKDLSDEKNNTTGTIVEIILPFRLKDAEMTQMEKELSEQLL